jgi:hypothetical protein
VCERESDRKEVKDRTSLIHRVIERLQIEEAEKIDNTQESERKHTKNSQNRKREREWERKRKTKTKQKRRN